MTPPPAAGRAGPRIRLRVLLGELPKVVLLLRVQRVLQLLAPGRVGGEVIFTQPKYIFY